MKDIHHAMCNQGHPVGTAVITNSGKNGRSGALGPRRWERWLRSNPVQCDRHKTQRRLRIGMEAFHKTHGHCPSFPQKAGSTIWTIAAGHWIASARWLMPKSVSLTCPFLETRMLLGATSACTSPCGIPCSEYFLDEQVRRGDKQNQEERHDGPPLQNARAGQALLRKAGRAPGGDQPRAWLQAGRFSLPSSSDSTEISGRRRPN